jgi:hypothetical protein
MQLFTASPERDDRIRLLENLEVLGHGLARHVHVLAEGRANGREARREDEDVCGEYDESEQRSIAARAAGRM